MFDNIVRRISAGKYSIYDSLESVFLPIPLHPLGLIAIGPDSR